MRRTALFLMLILVFATALPAIADDLVLLVQQELQALGYDPGAVDGEMSTKTAIAISKFQAEQGLEVTGEVTPQLAGILKAVRNDAYKPATAAPPANAAAAPSPAPAAADLQARQQACLQQKIAEAEAKQKKKRGFGRLMRAASRIAGRNAPGGDLARATRDIYDATATAEDLAAAAKDLGLTEDDVEACRNPPAGGQ